MLASRIHSMPGRFEPPPANRDLSATGFWNAMAGPQAATYNGKTYLAWCNSAGDIYAAQYVHSTRVLSTPVLLLAGQVAVDGAIHVAPAILVRPSDHKIVVADVANGGTHRPSVWISTSAEDATAFGAGVDIGTSGTYTYVDLITLGTDIYLITAFWTGGTRDMAWYVSSDGGVTWGAKVTVMHPSVDSTFFWHVVGNGSRIDIYSTDTDRSSAPSKVYHSYWDGSTLRNSGGTSLGSLAAFSNDGTLVSDASLGGVYVTSATTDGGNPAGVMFADNGLTTLQRRAVWNGATWALSTVVDQGGFIGGNANITGGAIAFGDKTRVYAPRKVGSNFEMFQYVTGDDGASWSESPMTTGSTSDNASPSTPQDATAALSVIWGYGTYTSDSTFTFDIHGWGI